MRPCRTAIGTLLALAALDPVAVTAADHPVRSLVTTVDLARCQGTAPTVDRGPSWRCTGLPGYPVHVAMVGQRTYLSAGAEPEKRRAARQTLEAVNSAVDARSGHITIEWRVSRRGGEARPYAMIVRYATASEAGKGEVLVVSRVAETESCQVARIDALANADAMVLARAVADGEAKTFDCAAPPKVVGRTGRSPM